MIDTDTVSALVTARGLDPAAWSVAVFYLLPTNPQFVNGACLAMLASLDASPVTRSLSTGNQLMYGYGATPEEAVKALFTGSVTVARAAETAAVADATAKAAAARTIEAAATAVDKIADVAPAEIVPG
jgi:hypothetical protein